MESLLELPNDLLILILCDLGYRELDSIARTCKLLHSLVYEFGWAAYLRNNPRPSLSLSRSRDLWQPSVRVRYDVLTDRRWDQRKFVARPLSDPWLGRKRPRLALSSSRLIIAAGHTLHSFGFSANKNPRVESETHLKLKDDPGQYVTAMACVPDDGICIGLQNGSLEFLDVSGQRTRHDIDLPPKDFVESLSASDDLLLALSANGSARLIDTALCQTVSSFEISSQTRSWKCHLNSRASSPYAAFGTSTDAKPLSIYSLSPSGFIPSLVLAQQDSIARRGLAVFDICQGPPCSVWGTSSIVSGWYDGTLSVHDLRSSDRDRDGRLRPVMTLSNSFSDEPIYSVGCGGGSGCYVAAGSARHSLVSFWDVRSANKGFSFHAPFNDASPVYALALESSRLFAVTQSRPFVVDFGPDVDSTTYPSPSSQSATSGLGYYVTQYQHARH